MPDLSVRMREREDSLTDISRVVENTDEARHLMFFVIVY